MTLRTLNYGNYGIFLIMGNAGFCPSTVALARKAVERKAWQREAGPFPLSDAKGGTIKVNKVVEKDSSRSRVQGLCFQKTPREAVWA